MDYDILKPKPGELIPWSEKSKEYEKILGNEEILINIWKQTEEIGNRFIWFCLTDF